MRRTLTVSGNFTPLFKLAIKSGLIKAVSPLIRKFPSLDVKDGEGLTPLMVAAQHGHYEICELLLTNGASPTVEDTRGLTAMKIAEAKGFTKIVQLLMPNAIQETALPYSISDQKVSLTPVVSGIQSQPIQQIIAFKPPAEPAEGLETLEDVAGDLFGWQAEEETRIPFNDDRCCWRPFWLAS